MEECKIEVRLRTDRVQSPSVPSAKLLDKVGGEIGALVEFLIVI